MQTTAQFKNISVKCQRLLNMGVGGVGGYKDREVPRITAKGTPREVSTQAILEGPGRHPTVWGAGLAPSALILSPLPVLCPTAWLQSRDCPTETA